MAFQPRLGDRRTDLRFEIIGQLWGALETVDSVPLRNLARGGALIEARTAPTPETFRAVRFGVNGKAQEIQVHVRHVTPCRTADGERYLVGLEFVEPSAVALDQIDRIVEARLAEMKSAPEA
jgi:hypothetical protein